MFYITISNGLLKDGHRKRMGASVWEFMWCLDKITKIDDEGNGWVLGGKPVKLKSLADDLETHTDTISDNLIKLEMYGYIEKRIVQHGMILLVKKAKKRFGKTTEPEPSRFGETTGAGSEKPPILHRKNSEPHIRCLTVAVRQESRGQWNPPAKSIAVEKAEKAWPEFIAALKLHEKTGARLVIHDPISRIVLQEFGGSKSVLSFLKTGAEKFNRHFVHEYAELEHKRYFQARVNP